MNIFSVLGQSRQEKFLSNNIFNLNFLFLCKSFRLINKMKYLILGIGNKGEKYENTRHNIGFKIVERIAEKNRCEIQLCKLWMDSRGKIQRQKSNSFKTRHLCESLWKRPKILDAERKHSFRKYTRRHR